jgi:hypothetical protein
MADEGRQKLIDIFADMKKEPSGLEQFAYDPVGYLQSRGINTDGLTLDTQPSPAALAGEVTDSDLAMVAGGGCFSLGYYGCYNEGD